MIEMAKVYAFPNKKRIPSGMKEELRRIAKDYVAVLYAIVDLMELEAEPISEDEIMELVAEVFSEGIYEAIEDLLES